MPLPTDQEQAYLDTLRNAYARIKQLEGQLQPALAAPVAVVGMACRLPGGADDLAKYWDLLAAGRDAITEMPAGRWPAEYLDPTPNTPGRAYTTQAGYLTKIDGFDHRFFGIAAEEALLLDPQQRLLLEVTAEALHHAGLPFDQLENTRTGVFIGAAKNKYADASPADSGPYTATGTTVAPLAGRLSYFLGLHGPCMTLDTACSSSLLAVHLALQSLRSGESDYALVGGVNLLLSPEGHISFSQLKALAPDGRCKTFDERADGFGRGEGCGVLVLRRLADAERAGNRILGLVTGSATNHDGRSNGFTAPSQKAQEEVIRLALRAAGRQPADLDFVEAHGTGTPLGDAIEGKALHAVFSPGRPAGQPLAIGSVKANLGHLEYAAGVAGIIKVLLSLERGELPGQPHFTTPNPHIPWETARLRVATELQAWPGIVPADPVSDPRRRVAGISGFGISGTNVHLVLEQYCPAGSPAEAPSAPTELAANALLPISAKSAPALRAMLVRLRDFVGGTDWPLAAIGAQLALRQTHFAVRCALSAQNKAELVAELDALLTGEKAGLPVTTDPPADPPRIVLVFPGQGGLWAGMGRELYQTNAAFRAHLAVLEAALLPHLGWSLCGFFEPESLAPDLDDLAVVQPLLFAVQVALARLWLDLGVQPVAVVGNSMGEIAAAHLAGALSLADAALLIGRRSRLLSSLAGQGAMGLLEWEAPADSPLLALPSGVEVAVFNSPTSLVVAGDEAGVAQLVEEFERRNLYARKLRVPVASHSQFVAPLATPLAAALAELQPQPTAIPFYSTVTGGLLNGPEMNADYWYRNLRQPVLFQQAVGEALAEGGTVFVEVSPHPTALGHVRNIARSLGQRVETVPTLIRQEPEQRTWLTHLGRLYTLGVALNWARLYPAPSPFVDLPSYPWQRRRFWYESAPKGSVPANQPAALPTAQAAGSLYELVWQPAALSPFGVTSPLRPESLLIMHGGGPFAIAQLERWQSQAAPFRAAVFGTELAIAGRRFELSGTEAGFGQLLAALAAAPEPVPTLVWLLETGPATTAALAELPADVLRLAAFSKALAASKMQEPLTLTLVGRSGLAVAPASSAGATAGRWVIDPNQAAVFGLAKVLHAESAAVQLRCLAVDEGFDMADLLAEVAGNPTDFMAGYALGQRYAEVLEPLPAAPTQPLVCQAEGVYVITGGSQGLGLEFAGHLSRRGARHLALLQRGPVPDRAAWPTLIQENQDPTLARRLRRYQVLEAQGATLHFIAVDVADRLALADALTMLRAQVGPIRGILHAAAGSADQFVAEQEDAVFRSILAPKVLGTCYLDELTQADDLEFFVLFSSLATLFHSGGQGAYVAANAFLDQYARQARAHGRPLTAIAWPIWKEAGRAAEAGLRVDTIFKALTTAQGLDLFERGLAAPVPQVLVGELNVGSPLMRLLAQAPFRLGAAVQLVLQNAAETPATWALAGPEEETLESPAVVIGKTGGSPLAEQVRQVWQRVLGQEAIGGQDNFFALGGNSILATRIVNQLRQVFPTVRIGVADMLKNLTINNLSVALAAQLGASGSESGNSLPTLPVAGLPLLRPTPPAERYPASQEQRRFWVQSQLDEHGALYNLTGAFRLEGPLDIPALGQALQRLIDRHETLRTTFSMANDQLWQCIAPPAAFILPVFDLSVYTEAHALAEVDARIQAEAHHHFDLAKGPLFRPALLQMPTADTAQPAPAYLLLNLHHIVADGWALGVFTRELATLYEQALHPALAAPLPPLALHYKDYAVWQQAVAAADALAAQRRYWHHKLGGTLAPLALPLDFPRPHLAASLHQPGERSRLWLEAEATAALQEMATRHNASLFMVVQALLKIYLFRVTGQADIALGVPTSVRPAIELEQLVGNFLNILVLRDELAETDTLLSVLDRVKTTTLEAYDHQLYPYDQLVDELVVQRQMDRNPLFDVLFIFQNHEEAEIRLGEARISLYYKDTEHSKADLSVEGRVVAGRLQLNLEYNPNLFRPATVAAFGAGLLALLVAAPGLAGQFIGALPLAAEAASAARAAAFNAPIEQTAAESTVWHRFVAATTAAPTAPALTYNGQETTYATLHTQATALADLLATLGLTDDGVAAVACAGTPAQIVALLAVFRARGIYLPLNLAYPAALLGQQLSQAAPRLLLCTAALEPAARALLQPLPGRPAYMIVLDEQVAAACFAWSEEALDYMASEPLPAAPEAASQPLPAPAAACYLFSTSGSTGQPKLILGSHRSLDQFVQWELAEFGLDSTVRVSQLAAPTFDASLRDVFVALSAGGTLVLPGQAERDDMVALAHWLVRERVSLVHTVPSLLRALLENDAVAAGFPALRQLILSGEPLAGRDVDRWRERYGLGCELVNFYGATETTLIRTFYRVPATTTGTMPSYLPAGQPIAGTRVVVVQGGQACGVGEAGEIYIKSPYFTLGYYRQENLTRQVFLQNPLNDAAPDLVYRTGDRGRLLPDGSLEVLGRLDTQVKINGIRLELGEVETACLALQGVWQAAVLAQPTAAGPVLVAYLRGAAGLDPAPFAEALRSRLPTHGIPALWVVLAEFPVNAHGKTDRARLPLPAALHPAPPAPSAADQPQNPTEQVLADLWAALLKRPVRGRHDTFFELGGNSLSAMLLLPRIMQRFEVGLTFGEFFRHPTVAGLAELLAAKQPRAYAAIPALVPQSRYAVSPAQQRMWILHHLEANSITYNLKRAFRLTGPLDADLLLSGLHELVTRHEVLRTTFENEGMELWQCIHPADRSGFAPLFIDLAAVPNPDAEAHAYANAEVETVFDLERGPLVRARLLRLEPDNYVFLLTLHHIVADGWTMELLLRELFADYDAARRGTPAHRSTPAVQYKEYAAWQNNLLHTGSLLADQRYWHAQLAGPIPVLELPADFPRAAMKTYRGAPVVYHLPPDLLARLNALAKKQEVSLFMLLLAGVKTLLCRYSGQYDLVIGAPVAGRNHTGLEDVAGFFVNTLALRTDIDPAASFLALLQQVRDVTVLAYEHQRYPFDKLVDELDLPRDVSRSPLFDVTVQLLNLSLGEAPGDLAGPAGIALTPLLADWRSSQFDLSFFFQEQPDGLLGILEYNSGLYRPERMARLIGHLTTLLDHLSWHPELPLYQLNYLGAEERAAVVHGFNTQPPALMPVLLVGQLLEQQAALRPNAPALWSAAGTLSFGELDAQANQLARFLVAQSGDPAAPVAVLAALGPATALALVAIHKAGKTYLPLDPAHPLDRLRYLLTDAAPAVLLTLTKHVPLADKLQWECASVQTYVCLDGDPAWLAETADPAELMRADLWNYVGEQATDDIAAGGWSSSYTGQPLTRADMDEYAANVVAKLRPHLRPAMRVLEIGCSSGITMFALAPFVAQYVGTDLSAAILAKTAAEARRRGAANVELHTLRADEIDGLPSPADFDLVILNSVVQSFGGVAYLRDVIAKVLTMCAQHALIFFGDVQDLTRKGALVASLEAFREANSGRGYVTKTDWNDELFLAPAFFDDLRYDYPGVVAVETSDKLGQLRNELSLFRFDTLLRVDKTNAAPPNGPRHKQQLGTAAFADFATTPLPQSPDAAALAYLIYTSGTTGRPKGVAVSQGALASFINGMHQLFGGETGPADRLLSVTKSTFDVSLFELFVPLCAGSTVCFADFGPALTVESLARELIEQHITWAFIPPALLAGVGQQLLAHPGPVALNKLLVGVEPIASEVLELFRQLNSKILIVNAYGPTEATVCATALRYELAPDDTAPAIVSIGQPLPRMQVLVLDAWQQPQGFGIPGELYLAGAGLAEGYWKQPDLTALQFAASTRPELAGFGRLYRTGDLGSWQPDGTLRFGGRADQQLKLRGFRIEPGEVEQQLLTFTGVQQAVVGTFVDADGEPALAAWYVADDDLAPARLRAHLARFLPDYMLPAHFVRTPTVPLTAHGKIDRTRLPRPTTALTALPDNFCAPAAGLEAAVAALWQDVLGLVRVGADDNFFELGGHSLKATRLVSRAFKDLGLDLQLVEVFTHPTVRGQAALLAARQHRQFEPLPLAPVAPHYPLSEAQQRLWVIERMLASEASAENAYNMVGASLLIGAIDAALLSAAFAWLVERHESLRTNFVEPDDEPRQLVHAHRAFEVTVRPAPAGPDEAAIIAAAIKAEAATPFNLEQDMLLRCKLLQLPSADPAVGAGAPGRCLLLFSMHHIISDGWSMGVLLRELHTCYTALAQGQQPQLPPLPVQYKDYAVWSLQQVPGLAYAGHRAYWHRALAGDLAPLTLPYDFERPAVQAFGGGTLTLRFPAALTARLHAVARCHDATLFMLAVALTHTLLYRYSGAEDIRLGTPIAGREHPDLEHGIGFYVNTLVLRNQLAGSGSFAQLLALVRDNTLSAFQHQAYPFNRLVEELVPRRDRSRFPLFDVLVVLQNNQVGTMQLPGLVLMPIDTNRTVSRFDLNFMFEEHADELVLQLQYSTSLFSADSVARMLGHLGQLAESSATTPESALDDLEMLTTEEIQALLA